MSAMLALFEKVGTEFSQETAASDSDDDSSHSEIVVQISIGLFVHVHLAFLSPSPIQSEHPPWLHYSWHFKSRTWEQPELERPRVVRGSDPVSKTKSRRLILIRSTHVVANFIYFAERHFFMWTVCTRRRPTSDPGWPSLSLSQKGLEQLVCCRLHIYFRCVFHCSSTHVDSLESTIVTNK